MRYARRAAWAVLVAAGIAAEAAAHDVPAAGAAGLLMSAAGLVALVVSR